MKGKKSNGSHLRIHKQKEWKIPLAIKKNQTTQTGFVPAKFELFQVRKNHKTQTKTRQQDENHPVKQRAIGEPFI